METVLSRLLNHIRRDYDQEEAAKDHFRPMYDNWAPNYEKDIGKFAYIIDRPMAELFDKAVLKTFRGKAKEDIKILDVAAGTGLIGVQLQKLGYTTLHALDGSQEMLNEAKKKNIYKRFFCLLIDGQQISEISTGEYDALICASAFGNNHILPTALKEMCRIITKGGLLCFDIYEQHLDEWQNKLLEFQSEGIFDNVMREKIPLYGVNDYPDKTNAFVYKVL